MGESYHLLSLKGFQSGVPFLVDNHALIRILIVDALDSIVDLEDRFLIG